MINDMKMWVNGREINIPKEIQEAMSSMMNPIGMHSIFPGTPRTGICPGIPYPGIRPPFTKENQRRPGMNRVYGRREIEKVPRKVLVRDEFLRDVVIKLNIRVMELEKKLADKPKKIKKDNINKAVPKKKVIPKIKGKAKKQKKGSVKVNTSKTKKVRKR